MTRADLIAWVNMEASAWRDQAAEENARKSVEGEAYAGVMAKRFDAIAALLAADSEARENAEMALVRLEDEISMPDTWKSHLIEVARLLRVALGLPAPPTTEAK